MARALNLLSLIAVLSLLSGCAVCAHPFDCSYQYQGGVWQRNNPDYGRVGSAFTPEVGSKVETVPATTIVQGEPTPAPRSGQPGQPTRPVRPRTSMGEAYLPAGQ